MAVPLLAVCQRTVRAWKSLYWKILFDWKDDELIEQALKTKQYKMLCLSDDKPELEFEKEKEWLKKLITVFIFRKIFV